MQITEEDVRGMTADERARLARMLAEMTADDVRDGPLRQTHRGRFLRFVVLTCVLLIPWTAYLAITLPPKFTADRWSLTWTGFDVALIAVIAATGWAAVRRRQFVAIGLVVWGTLLACDAWFDVTLDWGSPGLLASLLTALFVELPVSAMAFMAARNLWMRTIWTARLRSGVREPVHSLWRVEIYSLREVGREEPTGIPLPVTPR